MKKMFTVELQIGNNEYGRSYSVVAPNLFAAVRKAIRQAKKDTGNHSTRWRCTHANENQVQVL